MKEDMNSFRVTAKTEDGAWDSERRYGLFMGTLFKQLRRVQSQAIGGSVITNTPLKRFLSAVQEVPCSMDTLTLEHAQSPDSVDEVLSSEPTPLFVNVASHSLSSDGKSATLKVKYNDNTVRWVSATATRPDAPVMTIDDLTRGEMVNDPNLYLKVTDGISGKAFYCKNHKPFGPDTTFRVNTSDSGSCYINRSAHPTTRQCPMNVPFMPSCNANVSIVSLLREGFIFDVAIAPPDAREVIKMTAVCVAQNVKSTLGDYDYVRFKLRQVKTLQGTPDFRRPRMLVFDKKVLPVEDGRLYEPADVVSFRGPWIEKIGGSDLTAGKQGETKCRVGAWSIAMETLRRVERKRLAVRPRDKGSEICVKFDRIIVNGEVRMLPMNANDLRSTPPPPNISHDIDVFGTVSRVFSRKGRPYFELTTDPNVEVEMRINRVITAFGGTTDDVSNIIVNRDGDGDALSATVTCTRENATDEIRGENVTAQQLKSGNVVHTERRVAIRTTSPGGLRVQFSNPFEHVLYAEDEIFVFTREQLRKGVDTEKLLIALPRVRKPKESITAKIHVGTSNETKADRPQTTFWIDDGEMTPLFFLCFEMAGCVEYVCNMRIHADDAAAAYMRVHDSPIDITYRKLSQIDRRMIKRLGLDSGIQVKERVADAVPSASPIGVTDNLAALAFGHRHEIDALLTMQAEMDRHNFGRFHVVANPHFSFQIEEADDAEKATPDGLLVDLLVFVNREGKLVSSPPAVADVETNLDQIREPNDLAGVVVFDSRKMSVRTRTYTRLTPDTIIQIGSEFYLPKLKVIGPVEAKSHFSSKSMRVIPPKYVEQMHKQMAALKTESGFFVSWTPKESFTFHDIRRSTVPVPIRVRSTVYMKPNEISHTNDLLDNTAKTIHLYITPSGVQRAMPNHQLYIMRKFDCLPLYTQYHINKDMLPQTHGEMGRLDAASSGIVRRVDECVGKRVGTDDRCEVLFDSGLRVPNTNVNVMQTALPCREIDPNTSVVAYNSTNGDCAFVIHKCSDDGTTKHFRTLDEVHDIVRPFDIPGHDSKKITCKPNVLHAKNSDERVDESACVQIKVGDDIFLAQNRESSQWITLYKEGTCLCTFVGIDVAHHLHAHTSLVSHLATNRSNEHAWHRWWTELFMLMALQPENKQTMITIDRDVASTPCIDAAIKVAVEFDEMVKDASNQLVMTDSMMGIPPGTEWKVLDDRRLGSHVIIKNEAAAMSLLEHWDKDFAHKITITPELYDTFELRDQISETTVIEAKHPDDPNVQIYFAPVNDAPYTVQEIDYRLLREIFKDRKRPQFVNKQLEHRVVNQIHLRDRNK